MAQVLCELEIARCLPFPLVTSPNAAASVASSISSCTHMYHGLRAARSRLKFCRLAPCMPRPSPFFVSFETKLISVAENCTFHLGFYSSCSVSLEDPDSADNPSSNLPFPPGDSAKLIWAEKRYRERRNSRSAVRNNRIPGFVVDLTDPSAKHLLISMNKSHIESLWSLMDPATVRVTVFDMVISSASDSEKVLHRLPVLPRRINYDDKGGICNIGFAKALPGVKIKLDVPIFVEKQECIGEKKGGILKLYMEYVTLFCSPEDMFPCVKIDATMMDIGDKIYLQDLNLGVSLHSSNELSCVVCEVV